MVILNSYNQGSNNPNYKGGLPKCIDCDKQLTKYGAKRCKSHAKFGYRNHAWKGDKVGYVALHDWVYRTLGKPTICFHCHKHGTGRFIQWANISGEYKREITDWMSLCASCHKLYDLARKESEWQKH